MLDFFKKTYPPKGDRSKNQMKTIQGGSTNIMLTSSRIIANVSIVLFYLHLTCLQG